MYPHSFQYPQAFIGFLQFSLVFGAANVHKIRIVVHRRYPSRRKRCAQHLWPTLSLSSFLLNVVLLYVIQYMYFSMLYFHCQYEMRFSSFSIIHFRAPSVNCVRICNTLRWEVVYLFLWFTSFIRNIFFIEQIVVIVVPVFCCFHCFMYVVSRSLIAYK